MVRDLVLDSQAAKPAIGQVHLHLATQQSLRAYGEHITENEHPDHEHRINRGAAERRVVGRQLPMDPGQIEHSGDLADAMIRRNHVLEAERIEQLALVLVEPPHHRQPPPLRLSAGESRFADRSNTLLQQNLPDPDSCTAANVLWSAGSWGNQSRSSGAKTSCDRRRWSLDSEQLNKHVPKPAERGISTPALLR